MSELLNPTVKKRLQVKYQQLRDAGELISKDLLNKYYQLFNEKFGIHVLESLDGRELLEFMHNASNKDSLVYWLEFKNDDEFPGKFGSIAGGSSLKFRIYRRAESGEWMTGSSQNQKVLTVEEAIEFARQHKYQFIEGAKLLSQMPSNPSEQDYIDLQAALAKALPDLHHLAWTHKYLSLLFPNILDDFHSTDWQKHHLIKLQILPPENFGRYQIAYYYRSIAEALNITLNSLTTTLNAMNGGLNRYWRIGTKLGAETSIWNEMIGNKIAAIGFNEIGDLSDLKHNQEDKNRLRAIMDKTFTDWPAQTIGNQTGQLFNFATAMTSNDVIVACDGGRVLGIGINIGDYEYEKDSSFPHRRSVDWISTEEWKMPEPEGLRTTVKEIKKYPQNLLQIEQLITEVSFDIPIEPDDIKSIPSEESYVQTLLDLEKTKKLTTWHKQLLLHHYHAENYTTSAIQMAKALNLKSFAGANGAYGSLAKIICNHLNLKFDYNIAVLVRFGRDKSNNNEIQWIMHPPLVKALQKLDWKVEETIRKKPIFPRLSGVSGKVQNNLKRKKQVILYGPPGTGKTYWGELTAKELAAQLNFNCYYNSLSREEKIQVSGNETQSGYVRFCTFHPEFGYEHFIEGYWPRERNGQMIFELRDGLFKQICRDAEKSLDKTFFLIIDEINRGDIPRIFGELLTLIETDKRGKKLMLPYSGKPFSVPKNLMIIGTMNTADRSIALLDTALRRRFGFVELMPDISLFTKKDVLGGVPLGLWLKSINERICENLGLDARNLQIGHSYLLDESGAPVSKFEHFMQIIKDDIIPLLEEYCYEDYQILAKILGSALVDVSKLRIRSEVFEGDEDNIANAIISDFPDLKSTAASVENDQSQPEEDESEDEEPENDR